MFVLDELKKYAKQHIVDEVKREKFLNEIKKLEEKLDSIVLVEDLYCSGAFYNYINNNKIIKKILDNWIGSGEKYDKQTAIDDCLNELNKENTVRVTDENKIRSIIYKIYNNTESFFIETRNIDQNIQDNILRDLLMEDFNKYFNTKIDEIQKSLEKISNKIDVSTEKILNNGKISLKDASDKTKNQLSKRFLNMGVFEQNIKISDNEKINLLSVSDMYIEPTMTLYNNQYLEDGKSINSHDLIEVFINHQDEETLKNILDIDDSFLDDMFKDYKKFLFIYGDAGVGKSTFLQKQCMDMSSSDDSNIYFLTMKNLKFKDDRIFYKKDELILDNIKDNSVIYIDGFDESSDNNTILKTISNEIDELDHVNSIKFIITSRFDYKINGDFEKYTMYSKINFLADEDIYSFIKKYFTNYNLMGSKNYVNYKEYIENAIELENNKWNVSKNDNEFNIQKIPIILYIFSNDIVTKALENRTFEYSFLETNKYHIYKNILGEDSHIYKKNYDILKGTPTIEKDVQKISETLKNISLEMFRQDNLCPKIDTQSLEENFGLTFENLENRVGVGEFYMYIKEKGNLFEYEFYHKSFYEYFVAEKMADYIVEQLINYHYNEIVGVEKLEKFLNVYFGSNHITEEIYYFLIEVIKDKYKDSNSDLKKVRADFFNDEINPKNNFIMFFREFIYKMCLPNSFDNDYLKRENADVIMSNTFHNVTTILLSVLRESKEYKEKLENDEKGINILGVVEIDTWFLSQKIKNLMSLKDNRTVIRFFDDISFDACYVMLDGVNLNNYNFENANLSFMNLQNTELFNANLNGANLTETDLSSTSLVSANLQYVDLRDADLTDADLRLAYLDNANLNGAEIYKSDIENWPLSEQELLERGVRIYDEYGNLI